MGTMAIAFITIISIIITILLMLLKNRLNYWKKRNIYTPPIHLPFGNLTSVALQKQSFDEFTFDFYQKLKKMHKPHGGFYLFHVPFYFPIDNQLIRNIIQRDFNHFIDRGLYSNAKDDPISLHLLAMEGVKWRKMRTKLTPGLTPMKIRKMIPTMTDKGMKLVELLASNSDGYFDAKSMFERFTTDVVGRCVFGIDCRTMIERENHFQRAFRHFLELPTLELIRNMFCVIFPRLMRHMHARALPAILTDFFGEMMRKLVDYRENCPRKKTDDFLDLLIRLKNAKTDSITMDELIAQAFIIFLGSYETSSTTSSLCLHELAKHPDIQDRLRNEIFTVLERHDQVITHDVIKEMSYLGQVVNETLRLHPPLSILLRICVEDYKVPGTDLTIEKGTRMMISTRGLHYDPEYFPNPEKFDPDRFSEENRKKHKPFSFLPFGEGPRMCVGSRLAFTQIQIGLIMLLKNFKFTINERSRKIQMNRKSFILIPSDGVWLNYTKLKIK